MKQEVSSITPEWWHLLTELVLSTIYFRIVFSFWLIRAASWLPCGSTGCSVFDMKFLGLLYHFGCEEGGGSRGTVPAFGHPTWSRTGPWQQLQHSSTSWGDAQGDIWPTSRHVAGLTNIPCFSPVTVEFPSCPPPPAASSLWLRLWCLCAWALLLVGKVEWDKTSVRQLPSLSIFKLENGEPDYRANVGRLELRSLRTADLQ